MQHKIPWYIHNLIVITAVISIVVSKIKKMYTCMYKHKIKNKKSLNILFFMHYTHTEASRVVTDTETVDSL